MNTVEDPSIGRGEAQFLEDGTQVLLPRSELNVARVHQLDEASGNALELTLVANHALNDFRHRSVGGDAI